MHDPVADPAGTLQAATEFVGNSALDPADVSEIAEAAFVAVEWVRRRGARLRWVEETLGAPLDGPLGPATAWARFDLAIVDGTEVPLEIVDWSFSATRFSQTKEIADDLGVQMYRLVSSFCDQERRPLAVTLVQLLPELEERTIVMTREQFNAALARVRGLRDRMQEAHQHGDFPARPGFHCAWCSWRVRCPSGPKTDTIAF